MPHDRWQGRDVHNQWQPSIWLRPSLVIHSSSEMKQLMRDGLSAKPDAFPREVFIRLKRRPEVKASLPARRRLGSENTALTSAIIQGETD